MQPTLNGRQVLTEIWLYYMYIRPRKKLFVCPFMKKNQEGRSVALFFFLDFNLEFDIQYTRAPLNKFQTREVLSIINHYHDFYDEVNII